MSPQPDETLMQSVEGAVHLLLHRHGQVRYPSLLREMGVLAPGDLDVWCAFVEEEYGATCREKRAMLASEERGG